MGLIALFVSSVLVNNILLARFLGCCPFLGVSSQLETAKGMGVAVVFVTTFAAIMTWLAYNFILVPLGLEYLYTLAFILIIAALVQFVETVLKKMMPGLYKSLGIFLPLITTNCAVLGVAVINMNENYNFIYSVVNAFGSSAGFLLAIVLMAGIREKIEMNTEMPRCMRGLPIALVTAGLMSIASWASAAHQIGGTDMEGILYPTLVMGGSASYSARCSPSHPRNSTSPSTNARAKYAKSCPAPTAALRLPRCDATPKPASAARPSPTNAPRAAPTSPLK